MSDLVMTTIDGNEAAASIAHLTAASSGVKGCRTPLRRRGSGTVARASARSCRSPPVAGTRSVAVLRTWPERTTDTAGMGEDVSAGVAFW